MSSAISLLLLLPWVVDPVEVNAAEVYTDKAKIEGLGEISLPPGKWELEIAVKQTKEYPYDLYVFKKQGDRIERLSFRRVPPEIAGRITSYADSVGDSFSKGIPLRGKEKCAHDTAHILSPLTPFRKTDGRDTAASISYIYTSEKEEVPWMSHACITEEGGAVMISVHASPHVLSPDTITGVVGQSKFDKPPTSHK
jgi:hypothetical protein